MNSDNSMIEEVDNELSDYYAKVLLNRAAIYDIIPTEQENFKFLSKLKSYPVQLNDDLHTLLEGLNRIVTLLEAKIHLLPKTKIRQLRMLYTKLIQINLIDAEAEDGYSPEETSMRRLLGIIIDLQEQIYSDINFNDLKEKAKRLIQRKRVLNERLEEYKHLEEEFDKQIGVNSLDSKIFELKNLISKIEKKK